MADNDQPKIRYDDFVRNVQPDPAKPEPTIMLSGFVGHGPDGHARIYPDPALSTWYDVPEGDVIHSVPIADSKLGGSYLWVRANAQIKPGGSVAAAEAVAAPQPQAVLPQPTPATHCFICPPPTQNCTPATICTLHQHCPPQPTPATMCIICPPHQTLATVCTQLCTQIGCPPHQTLATVCTQIGCPPVVTQPPICGLTQPVVCGVLPPSIGCPPGGPQAQPQALAAAPRPPLQTSWFDCHTNMAGCTVHICAQGAQPAAAPAAMAPTPTVMTHCFVCPPQTVQDSVRVCDTLFTQIGCQPQTMHICPTPSAVNQCGGPPHPTLATLCTMPPACPPGGGLTLHPTVCICATPGAHTHAFCAPTMGTACMPAPGRTVAGCTPECQGVAHTLATLCTHPGFCPTQWNVCPPGQNGVFTPFGR
jgi:hypothetical protein